MAVVRPMTIQDLPSTVNVPVVPVAPAPETTTTTTTTKVEPQTPGSDPKPSKS